MDSLIQKCHVRREEMLTQQQTEVLSAGYSEYPYHFRVHYAHEKSALLYDFERADISVIPIGKVPFDRAPSDWLRKDRHRNRVDERQGARDWMPRQWFASWGIGIYTGETSAQDNANWHDITFTPHALCEAFDMTQACLEALINAVKDPLVTLTKDGGLRFTCRIPDYLHPNTVSDRLYVHKDRPTQTDPKNRDVYVIVKGHQDYSVWDARHDILMGSVFQPPLISKDVLFALIRFFKTLLHNPAWSVPDTRRERTPKALDVINITKPLAIDVHTVDESVSQQMRDIRHEQLSPLAIQRPEPVITKQPLTEPADIAEIVASDADVIGIQTGLRGQPELREIERAFLERDPIFLFLRTTEHCESASAYHRDMDAYIMEHETWQPLCNPLWHPAVEPHFDERDRVCILHALYPSNLFVKHELSINVIKGWTQEWQNSDLIDFGHALCNALEIIESDKTDNIAARVRGVIKAFENVKDTLIAQMSQGNVSWTYWHQLKQFFDHYPRDADAPMSFDGDCLQFRSLPVIHPCAKKFVILSPTIDVPILQRAFPDKKVESYNYGTQAALTDNRVYQLRSEVHSPHSLLNYDLDWDALSLSAVGTRYAVGMHHEIQQAPETQHTIISTDDIDTALSDTLSENNVRFLFFHTDEFEDADVVWVFGTPYVQPEVVWRHAKRLFGDMAEPLDYTVSTHPYRFRDPRIQQLSEAYSRQVLMSMLASAGLSQATCQTLVIQTALWLPGITDAPETRLFDWEDFEIAGGLEKLDRMIETREAYECRASGIDASWMPYQVMPILGVDRKGANRILKEVYGQRYVKAHEEVLFLLKETGTPMQLSEIKEAILGRSVTTIDHALKKLCDDGVVVKHEWGVYGVSEV